MPAVPRPRSRSARRLALVLAVVALALTAVAGAHLYVARRFVLDPGLQGAARALGLGVVALGFASFFVWPLAERRLGRPWRVLVCFPALLWMGVLWIAFNALWISDGLLWMMGAAAAPGAGPAAGARAAVVGAGVAVAVAAGLRGALALPSVRRVEVRLEGWPAALDGLRIAQISDLHIGPIRGAGFAEALVRRVNALGADLVAVTGDLVDGAVERVGDEVAPFAALRAPLGVFFVTGNHDVYSGDAAWVERVRELGLRPLRNERVALGPAGARFDLAGVDDHRGDWVRGSSEDLPRALAGRDPRRPLVLLAHDPSTFVAAARAGVDLQLSGHTHGGQIWPFGAIVRLAVPFVAGLYRRGRSQLYVSRGTGFWGPPLRLLAPAEITELVLRPAEPPSLTRA